MYRLFLLIFLTATSAFVLQKDIAGSSKSEKTFELNAGNTTMKISANGGRIISFRLGNKELIWSAVWGHGELYFTKWQ